MISSLLGLVPWYLRAAALAALAVALVGYGYTKGLDRGQTKLDAFVAKVGELAHKQAERNAREIGKREAITELLAQEHEDEAQMLRARNADLARRLRDANASTRVVPAVPSATGRPDGEVCYDSIQLDRALRASLGRLSERLARIVGDGDEALGLTVLCSRWLNQQLSVPRGTN